MKYNRKTRKNRKNRKNIKKRSLFSSKYTKSIGGSDSDITYIFVITYRAKTGREKRREQLQKCIENIKTSFTKYNKKYKIVIAEQNNENAFNMGKLHNIGFLEAEKKYNFPKLYFHDNVDYYFDNTKDFPKELEDFKGNGFLDIYILDKENIRVGALCCFGAESFKEINGFPNNIAGHGPYDIVLRYRVDKMKVPYKRMNYPGWIYDDDDAVERNASVNVQAVVNDQKSKPIETNGLNTCKYTIEGNGEFNDENNGITHLLANFTNE